MKKISILLSIIFLLSSCFTSPEDVNNAKKDMWIIEEEIKNDENKVDEEVNSETETGSISINSLTEDNFIKIGELDYNDFLKWEAEISWTTLEKIDKIEVSFKNNSSEFPDDLFELKQFKPWDKSFVYRAHTNYRVLDFWVNEYIFTAYVWDKVSKTQIIVNVINKEEVEKKDESEKEEEKDPLTDKKEDIESVKFDKINLDNEEWSLDLPSWWAYWHPISLWENWFTYSDISWLEINKYSFSWELSCESEIVTQFLTKEIWTWFYWNTCRNILPVKEWEETKAISMFVIRLDWEKYIYEKHFLDMNKWLYWKYEIEKWTWVGKDTIWEKNTELKESNDDIINIDIVDNLFKIIVKG